MATARETVQPDLRLILYYMLQNCKASALSLRRLIKNATTYNFFPSLSFSFPQT